jgi:uncharacterized protein
MSPSLLLLLSATILGTAFLSGIFGMAGGLILIGVLLVLLPLPEAMALHAVTQIASNAWRGLLWWRHVRWRAAASFLLGSAVVFAACSMWRFVPDKPVAFILLGLSPFLVRLLPADLKPNPERLGHGLIYGGASMALMLLSGVSGPLIDSYFLGGNLDRRQIIATKAVCQIVSHAAKLVYFGSLVEQAAQISPIMAALAIAATLAGTAMARPILERLSEAEYRKWANRIVAAVGSVFLAQGIHLLWA